MGSCETRMSMMATMSVEEIVTANAVTAFAAFPHLMCPKDRLTTRATLVAATLVTVTMMLARHTRGQNEDPCLRHQRRQRQL
mmetsp:Transcript_67155/g.131722  ORF Transcript_67155/g.131722 Transcript_67155/m.131722 type:complete len:82 (+) Transcript_67155:733-978(+)